MRKILLDAHISFQIADYERLYPLLAETDFPDELIMRSNSVRFCLQRTTGQTSS